MNKEKQIEDMTELLWHFPKALCLNGYNDCEEAAKLLYKAGYRKQSEPISCGHEKGGEWISIDERLPECERGAESKAVLFITKQGFMYTGYYGCGGIFHDRYFREFKNATEGYDISNVTHWMPLPQPPKMKGGDNDA